MSQARSARPTAPRKNRPWGKSGTRPITETGWTLNLAGAMPWVPGEDRLAGKRHADRGDAAAVVELITHCHRHNKRIPDWLVAALDRWLTEFVAMATAPSRRPPVRAPLFVPWAAEYVAALKDWMIADHLEANRKVYGLTWPEALDEASCHYRGTLLAGGPRQLKRAWSRARRRSRNGWFQRMPTSWESTYLIPYFDPPVRRTDPRRYWHIINDDRRGDSRGEWRERPRLLAGLSATAIERQANDVHQRWRRKWDHKAAAKGIHT